MKSFLALTLLLLALWVHPVLLAGPVPANKPESYPDWWFERDVISRLPAAANKSAPVWPGDYPTSDDFSAVNQGQLKYIAKQGYEEMKAKLPGGAGANLDATWSSPPASTDDFVAINIGQAKTVADAFYARLAAVGYTGRPLAPNQTRPWSGSADDYALANIGQIKNLFSFYLMTLDDVPPSAPEGVEVSNPSATSFTLGWHAASDNVGVMAYDIFKDGVQVGVTSGLSYTVSYLTPGKVYTIIVRARDSSGNVSAASQVVYGVPLPDVIAPVAPTGLTAINTSTAGFTLKWSDSSDNVAVDFYDVFIDDVKVSSTVASTYTVTGLLAGRSYRTAIKARDAASNISLASETLLVNTGPLIIGNQIAEGWGYRLVLKPDGTVWAWGANTLGQLGDGTTIQRKTPIKVNGLSQVVGITAGSGSSYALKSDGTVWAWGANSWNQLGIGMAGDQSSPVQVSGLVDVINIFAYEETMTALMRNGDYYIWGAYLNALPTKSASKNKLISVCKGDSHYIALDSDGNVWAWGRSNQGALGLGAVMTNTSTPMQVPGLSGVVSISAGGYHSVALKNDGSVWTWGGNFGGQLGYSVSGYYQYTPRQVSGINGVVCVTAGDYSTVVVTGGGKVWTWGLNSGGMLNPSVDLDSISAPMEFAGLSGVVSATTGYDKTTAIMADGTIRTWGGSGSNGKAPANMPVQPNRLTEVISVGVGQSCGGALKGDGTVWFWGKNYDNVLGNEFSYLVRNPVQPLGLNRISAISIGSQFSLAVGDGGSVWSWGGNGYGQLGDGSKTERKVPVQVAGLSGVKSVSAGYYHSLALKADGLVWSWGYNSTGQLGDGTTILRTSPVNIPGLSGIKAVAVGAQHSMAVKDDGTVWTWGQNYNGQLGDGTTTPISTPIKLLGLSGISTVSAGGQHSVALKDDGTVWTWGSNTWGQLGDSTTIDRTTPTRVMGLTGVVAISSCPKNTVALKNDGTVWAWGSNEYGKLGDGTVTDSWVPIQVRGLSGVRSVSAGLGNIVVSLADGTIRVLGESGNSVLGLANDLVLPYIRLTDLPDDTDHDGMSDIWEVAHFGNLDQPADGDLDFDGAPNFQEYVLGSDPTMPDADGDRITDLIDPFPSDYYDGAVPAIAIQGGNNQTSVPGQFNTASLDVVVSDSTGAKRLSNAPVKFTVFSGGGFLAATSAGNSAVTSDLLTRTDGNGIAKVFYKSPLVANTVSTVSATAGNSSVAFTLTTATDTLPPSAPGGLSVGSITNSSFFLSWMPASDDVAVSGYDIFKDGVLVGTSSTTSFVVSGLLPATSCWMMVKARDAAGNISSASSEFLVATSADIEAPSVPTGSSVSSVTASGFSLSWAGSVDNVAVTGYDVFMGGVKIGSTATLNYSVVNLAPLGAFRMTVRSKDAAGNVSGDSMVLIVNTGADITAPTVPIGLSITKLTATSFTLGWANSADDVSVVGYDIFQNGVKVGSSSSPVYLFTNLIPLSTYVMAVRASDAAGNISPLSVSLPVATLADTTPPSPPVGLGALGIGLNGFDLIWSPSEDNVGVNRYNIFKGGVLIGSTSVARYTVSGLAPYNSYSFTVSSIDTAGNESIIGTPLSVFTSIDTSSPSLPSGLSAASIGVVSFTLNWSASNDNVGVVGYDVFNNGVLVGSTGSTSFELTNLVPLTTYTTTVKARDGSGNVSASSGSLLVTTNADTTPPARVTSLSFSSISDSGCTISWSPSIDDVAVARYEVFIDGLLFASTVSPYVVVSGLSVNKIYIVYVRVVDTAGNYATWDETKAFLTRESVPPSVPEGLNATYIGAGGFTLNWVPATDNIGVTGYNVIMNGMGFGYSAIASIPITGLAPNTAYTMIVRSMDASGNYSAQSLPLLVTTTATGSVSDISPPSTPSSFTEVDVYPEGFTLSWVASTDNVPGVVYDIFRDSFWLGSSSTTSFSVVNLVPTSIYSMHIRARDTSGNVSAVSAKYVRTAMDQNSTPTGLSVSNVGASNFTLTWNAGIGSSGVVGYDVYNGGVFVGSSDTTSLVLVNLVPGLNYNMTVKAKDAGGYFSMASLPLFVSTVFDTIAPTQPVVSVRNLSLGFVELGVASTDNVAVIGYEVFRNGVSIGNFTGATYTLGNLTSSTTYTITLRAKDAAGNMSALSDPLLVTTLAPELAFEYQHSLEGVANNAWGLVYRSDGYDAYAGSLVDFWGDEGAKIPLHPVNSTPLGAPLWVQTEGGMPAVAINGTATTDYLKTDSLPFVPSVTNGFSFICLVRPVGDVLAAPRFDISVGDSGNFHFWADSTAGNKLKVSTGMGTILDNTPPQSVVNNQWQYWVFVFNNGVGQLYKNGELLATKSGMALPQQWTDLRVGRNSSIWLAELSFVAQALDASQVAAYGEVLQSRYAGLAISPISPATPLNRVQLIVPSTNATTSQLNGVNVNVTITSPTAGASL